MTPTRALVVCIGNELVADDAVGYAVFNALSEAGLPDAVRLEYCAVGGVAMLELLSGRDQLLIVVDAVQFGAPHGTVHLWSWDQLPAAGDGNAVSAHGIGLKDTIAIGRTLYPERMPPRILLVGVEGRCFDLLGEPMTPPVAAAVPEAVSVVCTELQSLFSADSEGVAMPDQPLTTYAAIHSVAEAMMAGRLDERCDPAGHAPQDAELLMLVNRMLDALIAPMRLAGTALDEIAHGRIPPFVIDEYKGEYNTIKQNINTLLAILYGMHKETTNLTDSVREGNLKTRGNDWDYDGIWQELIRGMNGTLDAVLDPVNEAGNVLGRLANYDLSARMRGRYHGDHAVIRKAMNSTAEALHGAISQVAETVELVSEVGRQISEGSSVVAEGATEQSNQLADTSGSLERIAAGAATSTSKTGEAKQKVHEAAENMEDAQAAMERMLGAMVRIREAAENTSAIVSEIDGIAKETGTLSTSALDKAIRIRTSAGGFGVVAHEIRKLGQRCTETAKGMKEFSKQVSLGEGAEADKLRDDFQLLIDDLEDVAMFSNLLGVNAAIEAAHVEGAGNDFRSLTDEIHSLATRSADAAKRTEQMTLSSLQLSRNGEELSRDINRRLRGAVEGAKTISLLTDEISQVTLEQATGIDQINQAVAQVNQVTQKNADSAARSSEAAQGLERQVEKLSKMVQKFRLEAAPAG